MRGNRILIVFLVISGVFISGCAATPPLGYYDDFSKCLIEKSIVEYGAYWCPNCARVKLTLGDAWYNLDYVECDPKCVPDINGNLPDFCKGFESQTDKCLEIGIEKYPSWVKNDQILYVGTDLNQIAEVSGCQLPE